MDYILHPEISDNGGWGGGGGKTHWYLLLQAAFDTHAHGGERGWAAPTGALQLQVYYRPVNFHELHIATICIETLSDQP